MMVTEEEREALEKLRKKIIENHYARKKDPEAIKRRRKLFREFGTLTEEDLNKRIYCPK